MCKVKKHLFGAMYLLGAVLVAPVAGQDSQPPLDARRGDPKSPGGRPLAVPSSKMEELQRTYNQLKKEQDEIRARSEDLRKKAAAIRKEGLELLSKVKVSDSRLEAANAAVDLGQSLGGVGERAYDELDSARTERRALRSAVDAWERKNNAVKGAQREVDGRSANLRRRIEAYKGAVAENQKKK